MVLSFTMLFFTFICTAEGMMPLSMTVGLVCYFLSSMWAFFNPVHIAGINALQSNASQLALVGGSTVSLLAGASGGIPFYMLYMILVTDTAFSSMEFFSRLNLRVHPGQDSIGTKDDMYESR